MRVRGQPQGWSEGPGSAHGWSQPPPRRLTRASGIHYHTRRRDTDGNSDPGSAPGRRPSAPRRPVSGTPRSGARPQPGARRGATRGAAVGDRREACGARRATAGATTPRRGLSGFQGRRRRRFHPAARQRALPIRSARSPTARDLRFAVHCVSHTRAQVRRARWSTGRAWAPEYATGANASYARALPDPIATGVPDERNRRRVCATGTQCSA